MAVNATFLKPLETNMAADHDPNDHFDDDHGSALFAKHATLGRGDTDRFEFLDTISRGAYGFVYKAWDKETQETVAMKLELDGLSEPTLREISILKSLLRHPSIVEFREVVVDCDRDNVYVVMEYMTTDLTKFIDSGATKPFDTNEVKRMMRQLLEGVKFLHQNGVMHRDIKPDNILMNANGDLKICDFGCSRDFGSGSGSYSPKVGSLWYNAPELLHRHEYKNAVDMWAVGCVMAELFLREALFTGNSKSEQLDQIHAMLDGKPLDLFATMSLTQCLKKSCKQLLRHKFIDASKDGGAPELTEVGFDLLKKLLAYDPNDRITAEAALEHEWFKET